MQPPKPPEILVEKITHHSVELSWLPYHEKLLAKLSTEDGRLRAEVQYSKFPDSWDVAYKGYDTNCVCAGLEHNQDYRLRFRFGNAHGWGEFSEAKIVRTSKKPFTGEDVHKQIRRRNLEQLQSILASKEPNPNAPDDKGFTPLTVAALDGLIDYCDVLLQYRADVNWAGDIGKTSLMLVSYKGKSESVEWLLDNGANLHARDRKGLTALHYAADGEQVDTVRLLLDKGADIHAKDNKGSTALIRCSSHKNNGNSAIAVVLLKAGAKVDETDASGQTALFYCVMNRHEKLAMLLLQHDANPTATNTKGVSPLKFAEALPEAKNLRQLLKDHAQSRKEAQAMR